MMEKLDASGKTVTRVYAEDIGAAVASIVCLAKYYEIFCRKTCELAPQAPQVRHHPHRYQVHDPPERALQNVVGAAHRGMGGVSH